MGGYAIEDITRYVETAILGATYGLKNWREMLLRHYDDLWESLERLREKGIITEHSYTNCSEKGITVGFMYKDESATDRFATVKVPFEESPQEVVDHATEAYDRAMQVL